MKYYTDGSTYPTNPGLGGAGFVVIGKTKDYMSSSYLGEGITNNEAEATAVEIALEFAITHNDPVFDLYSDSAYVMYGLNRILHKKPLLSTNQLLWEEIRALILNSPTMKIKLNHIQGHAGMLENECADLLAGLSAKGVVFNQFVEKGKLDEFRKALKAKKKSASQRPS